MLLNCGVGEDSWESPGVQGDPTSQSYKKPVLNIHRKDWCWSWNSNTLAPWFEEPTHWKKLWCWEILKAGEGDGRGWDGWMASLTPWTRVWANSRRHWRTGKPGALPFVGLPRVGHGLATEQQQREERTMLLSQAPVWVFNQVSSFHPWDRHSAQRPWLMQICRSSSNKYWGRKLLQVPNANSGWCRQEGI